MTTDDEKFLEECNENIELCVNKSEVLSIIEKLQKENYRLNKEYNAEHLTKQKKVKELEKEVNDMRSNIWERDKALEVAENALIRWVCAGHACPRNLPIDHPFYKAECKTCDMTREQQTEEALSKIRELRGK